MCILVTISQEPFCTRFLLFPVWCCGCHGNRSWSCFVIQCKGLPEMESYCKSLSSTQSLYGMLCCDARCTQHGTLCFLELILKTWLGHPWTQNKHLSHRDVENCKQWALAISVTSGEWHPWSEAGHLYVPVRVSLLRKEGLDGCWVIQERSKLTLKGDCWKTPDFQQKFSTTV